MLKAKRIRWLLATALTVAPAAIWAAPTVKPLEEQVRHQLVMLPFYGVFDNLSFRLEGSKVILTGQVLHPVLKRDAETVVKGLPGVSSVDNEIKILPPSNFDDRIRWAELRSVYGQDGLLYYGMGAIPSIHIIVDNGHVTLEGVVARQTDKALAGIAANEVPGVFSVTNNLEVRSS